RGRRPGPRGRRAARGAAGRGAGRRPRPSRPRLTWAPPAPGLPSPEIEHGMNQGTVSNPARIAVNGRDLTIWDVFLVARRQAPVFLPPSCQHAMRRSRAAVEAILADDRVVYGINTGFGFMKDQRISAEELAQLQVNLVRSHAAGVGESLP